jgi:hypothetical protein
MQLHHIVGGSNRSDEEVNFLALCSLCHGLLHGERHKLPRRLGEGYWPRITRGMTLTMKKLHDQDFFDLARLAVLLGHAPDDLEPLPDLLKAEHNRNKPKFSFPEWA